jgi:uncharacterized membrane protein YbjE (DUF340 family)
MGRLLRCDAWWENAVNDIKMPSRLMQGFVAAMLVTAFCFLVVGPSIPGYVPPSEATTQTVLTLVVGVVGYYLGTSQSSARKDELNAAQQVQIISALTPTEPEQVAPLAKMVARFPPPA